MPQRASKTGVPFHSVEAAGHLLAAQGGPPAGVPPPQTDRQPRASKPGSSRQELCDLGAGEPLRASVPKSVKWGTRLACAPWKEHPREGSALAGPLEASPPGSGSSSQACSPSGASGVSHPPLALRVPCGALSWVQLCLPGSGSLADGLGAGKKALTRSKVSGPCGAGAFKAGD